MATTTWWETFWGNSACDDRLVYSCKISHDRGTDVSTIPPNRSPTHQSIVETLQNSKGISLRKFQASGCKQTCRVLTYFLSHQKVAIGLKNLMNRVNFSLHLTHPLRNTALCAYPLGSQRHLKSSVKKWISFFLVSLAHFPMQMMLKCKGPQKNVMIFTCWKRLSEYAKQGWNLNQISAASKNWVLWTYHYSTARKTVSKESQEHCNASCS